MPKTVIIISSVLLILGIITASFGIYSILNVKASSEKQVDIKGEVLEVNDTDRNITVKYSYGDNNYTVILDYYENGLKKGDTVDLKVNPNDLSEVFKGWSPVITAIGFAVIISAVCIILHTVNLLRSPKRTLSLMGYAWIFTAAAAFASCALGAVASVSGKTTLGITVTIAGGAFFTVISWIIYIRGNKRKVKDKQRK